MRLLSEHGKGTEVTEWSPCEPLRFGSRRLLQPGKKNKSKKKRAEAPFLSVGFEATN